MGCCCSKNQVEPFPLNPSSSLCINEANLLSCFLNKNKLSSLKSEIDEPMVVIDKITLNPLGYSLVSNRVSSFINLIENMNASIACMEGMMERQGLNGLDLIIEKGYTDLLKYYLPIYKSTFSQRFSSIEDSETSCSYPHTRNSSKTPLLLATERGFLETIQVLNTYFKNIYTPEKYNIHHVDEYSGENSALIACKKCHLPIVKYLKNECNADFNLKSKRLESALHLAAFGSNSNKIEGFEVVKYLIEEVGIDFVYQYEETLLILNDLQILEYFEKKLKDRGICCSKEEVEKKYSISAYKVNKAVFLFEGDSDFTVGAISSIDFNATVGLMNGSSFLESDYN
ncbi:hypothetical protein SteCoe_37209 [Stentor coeruleus]|uniref:Uncharacterized protein n=1 Tax=Stentor coeruleus TaxID=5963 RepID=A0A1R2ANL0_9CILI|nr:hypothetical protein SteCoe_37209 [Stentor coeruleus]